MSVAFLAPHDPRTMPQEFLEPYLENLPPLPPNFATEHPFDNGELFVRDELLADLPRIPQQVRRHQAEYYAMIDHIDHGLGFIMQTLKQRSLFDNTIIIFSSDNGLAVGRHGLMGKQSCYDHSLRVPLIFAGPNIPKGVRRRQLCYLHDLFPTLCQYLDLPIPDSVQSRSLWDCIQNNTPHRETLYCGYRQFTRTVTRDDGWKLICTTAPDQPPRHQLFNLNQDPWEQHNHADDPDCQPIVSQLQTAMQQMRRDHNDPWQIPA